MTKDDVKIRLVKNFPGSHVEVMDITPEGNHFSVVIISDLFNDLSLLNRHKLIYSIFENELTKEIHALQIKALTQSEWNNK